VPGRVPSVPDQARQLLRGDPLPTVLLRQQVRLLNGHVIGDVKDLNGEAEIQPTLKEGCDLVGTAPEVVPAVDVGGRQTAAGRVGCEAASCVSVLLRGQVWDTDVVFTRGEDEMLHAFKYIYIYMNPKFFQVA